jgi:hypothetical protein
MQVFKDSNLKIQHKISNGMKSFVVIKNQARNFLTLSTSVAPEPEGSSLCLE